jgi:hypothetical protein
MLQLSFRKFDRRLGRKEASNPSLILTNREAMTHARLAKRHAYASTLAGLPPKPPDAQILMTSQ